MEPAPQQSFPLLHAPGPWLMHLVQQCDDHKVRLTLFQTNTQLRDLVLQAAPLARVTLTINNEPPGGDPGRLLAVRGDKPTRLSLLQTSVTDGMTHNDMEENGVDQWAMHLEDLEYALSELRRLDLPTVTQLSLYFLFHYNDEEIAAILSAAATAFPRLTWLHLDMIGCLPGPSEWPDLSELQIEWAASLCTAPLSSVSAYLPQLHRLKVGTGRCQWGDRPSWATLLANPSTTLTHLSTVEDLTDEFLDLLLSQVPSLRELRLQQLDLQHSHAAREWRVHYLRLGFTSLDTLCKLPRSTAGMVDVDIKRIGVRTLKVSVHSTQEQLDRLKEWRFVDEVNAEVRETEAEDEDADENTDTNTGTGPGISAPTLAALLLLLPHLGTAQLVEGSSVRLQDLRLDDAGKLAVTQATAAYPHLQWLL